MSAVPLKFFAFRQNNSGGTFDHDAEAGIGMTVFVQAVDSAHAEARGELIGLYFNGVNEGRDCGCCGDRWYGSDDGEDVPTLYGEKWSPVADGYEPTLSWGLPSYIHYMDGSHKAAMKVAA